MVELQLRIDPQLAWRYWEAYKGQALGLESSLRLDPKGIARQGRILQASLERELRAQGDTAAPTLVSYCAFADGVALWVWDGKDLRQLWISVPQQELEARVRRFVGYCSDPDSNLQALDQDARALYRLLIEPIEPWLVTGSRIVFEPDGILRSLPMEALIDTRGRYLGDRFEVTVSPGIEYLQHAQRWTGIDADARALVVGDPRSAGWIPLPDAKEEARAVAAWFHSAALVVDEPVTPDRLRKEMSRARVLHFSGHAIASGSSAGLVVGDRNVLGSWLTADGVKPLNELVVLSACASSRGTTGYYDDEDSLVRQIVSAGVPEVVASRWLVDSAATRQLMRDFYAGLFSGQSVSASLAGAERSLRLQPEYGHPFYWAGFSVFGRG